MSASALARACASLKDALFARSLRGRRVKCNVTSVKRVRGHKNCSSSAIGGDNILITDRRVE